MDGLTKVVTGEVTAVHAKYCSVALRCELEKISKGSHITFSMCDWQGNESPRCGQVVALDNLTLFRRGWRALKASPIQIQIQNRDERSGK